MFSDKISNYFEKTADFVKLNKDCFLITDKYGYNYLPYKNSIGDICLPFISMYVDMFLDSIELTTNFEKEYNNLLKMAKKDLKINIKNTDRSLTRQLLFPLSIKNNIIEDYDTLINFKFRLQLIPLYCKDFNTTMWSKVQERDGEIVLTDGSSIRAQFRLEKRPNYNRWGVKRLLTSNDLTFRFCFEMSV